MSPKPAPPRRREGLSPHGISLPLHGISSHLAVQSKGYAWGCQGKTPILLVDPDHRGATRGGARDPCRLLHLGAQLSFSDDLASGVHSSIWWGVVSKEGAGAGLTYQVAAFLNMTWVIMSAAGAPKPHWGSTEEEGAGGGRGGAAPAGGEVGGEGPAHALDKGLRPRPGVSAQGSLAGTKEISDALPGRADHAIAVEIVLEDDAGRLRHHERRDPG